MSGRVTTDGKHLSVDGRPFRVKGVTYGGFRARLDGARYPDTPQLKSDLHAIADLGLNTIRIYDLPPAELLDIASDQGLRVIVGIDYHDWRMAPDSGPSAQRRIREAGLTAVRDAMELCAGRSEVLAIAVGNEVPVDLVRLHGIGQVEDTLSALVDEVHRADSDMLATYISFPTTEFLTVENQDIACFNVFLEQPDAWRKYLRHLQVVAGTKPLVVTELGLASEIHGEPAQAEAIEWQLRTIDEIGVAGATVYAWTDEWAVNDEPVSGWGFGITTIDRTPKASVDVVESWARRSVGDVRTEWPSISVVVCAYNEELTLEGCLASLKRCEYPALEVVVCDDGSTDRTLEIARGFPFRVLELPHGGLSQARNAGMDAATGDIIAYLDADAACHPEWPFHLALAFEDDILAAGGPNLPVADAAFVERVVAHSPGGPVEVLVGDDRAEHVAGCNMAFRAKALRGIGGFDVDYTSAGDDVDVCWKLLDRGGEIGFSPAAQVRHHRRATVRGYLRQQKGYGRAEKMLSGPHRHRFNRLGQARWSGFLYGGPRVLPSVLRPVVYHGYQGTAPFQSVSTRPAEATAAWIGALLPLSLPIGVAGLALAFLSLWWLLVPLFLLVGVVAYGASVAASLHVDRTEPHPMRLRALAGLMHVMQPFVRAWGRLRNRPLPVRNEVVPPWWGDRSHWLTTLRRELESSGCRVGVGGPDQAWDLSAGVGPFLRARITTAVVWNWEPRVSVKWRPGRWLLAAIFGSAAGLVFSVALGVALAALVTVGAAADSLTARRRVNRAIEASTAGVAT